ncbi:MAG: glycoside hydrolase family 43 protein [Marinilabiliaceae bacterium]|nr:glycoside hydrolase family 43 protein [Marinilabiliaceae bacterium]
MSYIVKKQFLLLVTILTILSACQKQEKEVYLFTSFHEPADEGLRFLYSYDGYHWTALDSIYLKPSVGVQKVMRDPSIAKGEDGTFHLVWTSSWRGDKGFGYASSIDLINWLEPRMIEVMEDSSTVNVWAPEVFYDDAGDKFIIVWASTIPYKFEKGQEEEMNNHRQYYTTTKDFKTFSPTKLFLEPGFSCIDGAIVKRGREDYALVFKDNTRPMRNLKVAFSKSPEGPWENISDPITPTDWEFCEGPNVAKVDDGYLIYFDAYSKRFYGALKTNDFKNFESANDKITIPEGHKHGTIFKVSESVLKNILKHERKI